jgi:lipopolysaccharide/colanic/teichoic acid biosynthesis glycosyltransferase
MKRIFDIVFSFLGLLVLFPVMLVIAVLVKLDSNGSVFYFQERVGRHGEIFRLIKFRTMYTGSDKKNLITVGTRDPRITRVGYYLRKYKLDELPQLINVLKGDMSLVGPRPEVKKYVDLYSREQMEVLSVRPGITSATSLEFIDENAILGEAKNPEWLYINEIIPEKLRLDLQYVQNRSFIKDISILLRTFWVVLLGERKK